MPYTSTMEVKSTSLKAVSNQAINSKAENETASNVAATGQENITLDEVSQAREALVKLKNDLNEESVIAKMDQSSKLWASKFCEDLGIDLRIMEPLLPKIVDTSEITKLQAISLEKLIHKASPEMKKQFIGYIPSYFLPCFSDETLKIAFNDEEISRIRSLPTSNPNFVGGYMCSFHLLGYNIENLKVTGVSCEALGSHETNHGLNSLFRSMLSEEDLRSSVIEGLKDEVTNGSLGGLGTYMKEHPTYMPDRRMREEMANLVEELIKNRDDRKIYADENTEGNISITIHRLSDEGKAYTLELAKKHPNFMEACSNDENIAINSLSKLITNNIFKFDLLMGNLFEGSLNITIPKETLEGLPKNETEELKKHIYENPKALAFAKESAKKFVEVFEGNLLVQGDKFNPASYLHYIFCNEEVESYKVGSTCKLAIGDNDHQSIEKEQATIKLFTLGEQYIKTVRSLSILPQNPDLVKKKMTLFAFRQEHDETLRKIENFIHDKVISLSDTISELASVETSGKQLKAELRQSPYLSNIIEKHQEEIFTSLRNNRKNILQCLEKNNVECNEFKEMIIKEEEVFERILLSQKELSPSDFSPESGITDKDILKEIELLEKELLEIQKTAQFDSFRGFIPLVYKPESEAIATTREVSFDELPDEIKSRLLQIQKEDVTH